MKAVAIGLLSAVVGLGFLASGLRSLTKSIAARSWPTTTGAIQSSVCQSYVDMDTVLFRRSYFAQVVYTYAVADGRYQGDRIAFGYSGSWWRWPNQKLADRLSSAGPVQVRHDPKTPSTAVLSHGLNGSIVLTLFTGSWILLVTFLAMRYASGTRDRSGFVAVSWGRTRLKTTISGMGGIVLLAVAGAMIASLLGLVVDLGIVLS